MTNTVVTEPQVIEDPTGVRVVPPSQPNAQKGKVGRPKKEREETITQRTNKRQATQLTWSVTSRDEFDTAQCRSSDQRFERGEGGE